jgi:hypothetical protein
MVTMINAKANKIAFSSPVKLGKTKSSHMPIKAGQWATVLTTFKNAGNDVALSTTKIISVTGKTVVIEVEKYSAMEKGVRELTQITVENYPVKGQLSYSKAEYDSALQTMKIVKMKTKKGDEPVQEMPEQMLMMSQQMAKNMTTALIRSSELTTAACTTPYINASLCQIFDYTVSMIGITRTVRVTAHSDIPVNGIVKMESEDMDEQTIAFGNSGAVSAF